MSNSFLVFDPTPFTHSPSCGTGMVMEIVGILPCFFWTAHNLSGVMFMILNMLHTLRVRYINMEVSKVIGLPHDISSIYRWDFP